MTGDVAGNHEHIRLQDGHMIFDQIQSVLLTVDISHSVNIYFGVLLNSGFSVLALPQTELYGPFHGFATGNHIHSHLKFKGHRLIKRQLRSPIYRLPVTAHAYLGVFSDLSSQIFSFLPDFSRFHNAVDQPHAQRLFRTDRPASQDEVEGTAYPDQSRQPLGASVNEGDTEAAAEDTPSTAVLSAIRKSHQQASSRPPATAYPEIAAITGFESFIRVGPMGPA
jgi:hypothetical protein